MLFRPNFTRKLSHSSKGSFILARKQNRLTVTCNGQEKTTVQQQQILVKLCA